MHRVLLSTCLLAGLIAGTSLLAAACAPPGGGGASAAHGPSGDQERSAVAATPVTDAARVPGGTEARSSEEAAEKQEGKPEEEKVEKTEEQWREILTPDQFYVLRKKGTERAWTGQYDKVFTPGKYECVGCGQVLFLSDHKYDSGCGWPAFYKPADGAAVTEHADHSFGMVRTEVVCSKCDGHLGHVFEDGPEPTGLRYCINSAVLRLVPTE